MTTADRWRRAAERDTARRQKAAGPLFAALVEPTSPEIAKTRAEGRIAQMAGVVADKSGAEARGQTARLTVAAQVTADELAALDRRRAACPSSGEYTADFWSDECRRRGLPWPGQAEHEALWGPINAAVDAEVARRSAATGKQIDLPAWHDQAALEEAGNERETAPQAMRGKEE